MSEENNKNSSNGSGGKRYTIPRKQRLLSEDCQRGIPLDSREAREIINTVHHLTWESAEEFDRNFVISKIYKVDNQVLEREFQTKRTELRDEGRSAKELSEHYAFKAEYYVSLVKEQCKKGLYCNDSNSVLGDGKMGVSVWKCPDLCLKSLKWPDSWTVFLIVFRIVKGKVKPVTPKQPNQDTNLEPTPNYDCHVAKNVQYSSATDNATLMIKTQYYLYEYNEEGLAKDRPRHCLPFAVIHVNKAVPAQPEIKQPELIPVHFAVEDLHDTSPQETKVQYLQEDAGTIAWRGLIGNKDSSLGVVAIMAGHKLGLTLWKSFIDVRNKLPLNSLLKVIPGDIRTAWNKPLYYRGHTFSLCILKPCGPSDKFINFIKSLSMRDQAAGVVTVDSSTVMFLVPSSKLSVELGFCEDEEPWRMFCIVRRRPRRSPNTDTQSCLNTQACQPSAIEPQGLNINLKFEVPNLAKGIQELNVVGPCQPPVGLSFSRSKSVDFTRTIPRGTQLRRVSDTGYDHSKINKPHEETNTNLCSDNGVRLQQQTKTLSTQPPPPPPLILLQQVQQQHQNQPVVSPVRQQQQQRVLSPQSRSQSTPRLPLLPSPRKQQQQQHKIPTSVSPPRSPLLPTSQRQPLMSPQSQQERMPSPRSVSPTSPSRSPLLPTPQRQPLMSPQPQQERMPSPRSVSPTSPSRSPLLPTPQRQPLMSPQPQQERMPSPRSVSPTSPSRSPLLPTPQRHPLMSPQPQQERMPSPRSVSPLSPPRSPLLPTPQRQPLMSPQPQQTKHPAGGTKAKQQDPDFNNDFFKKVSLFRFETIPFLEHTGSPPEVDENKNKQKTHHADKEHEGLHVTGGNHSDSSSGRDVIMDGTCSSNLTKSTRKESQTAKEDVRIDVKYQKHLQTLVPCTNSNKTEKTKDNPIKTSPRHQASYNMTDTEPKPLALQLPPRDHGFPSSRDLSPRSHDVYTKHKETLKRKSSLAEIGRENIKKRKLDCGNGNDIRQVIPEPHSSTGLSDKRSGGDVALSEEQVTSCGHTWTSGLQVVELMMIEQEFQEIDEQIEYLENENVFEILDIDAVTEVAECQAATATKLPDSDVGVSDKHGKLAERDATCKDESEIVQGKIQYSKDDDLQMNPEEEILMKPITEDALDLSISVCYTQPSAQTDQKDHSTTISRQDQNNTLFNQNHTSTMSSQVHTSTMSSQVHTSTISSQDYSSTISIKDHTSTLSSQVYTSTMSSQDHSSTISIKNQTSTMSSQDHTKSTSPFLDGKENKTSDAPESEIKAKASSKPVPSLNRSIPYCYRGSSHLLSHPPPLKSRRLVNDNPCISPRYPNPPPPPRINNMPFAPLPSQRFCRLPSLLNTPCRMPFPRPPLFLPNGFPCRPPFVPRPSVAQYMCYGDNRNRVL